MTCRTFRPNVSPHQEWQPYGDAGSAYCGGDVAGALEGALRVETGRFGRAQAIRVWLWRLSLAVGAAHRACFATIARRLGQRGLSGID